MKTNIKEHGPLTHWLVNDDHSPGKARKMNITQEGEEWEKIKKKPRLTKKELRKAVKLLNKKAEEEEIKKRRNTDDE